MKLVIIGAGGIGAYYGARLQSLGHDVVYVARGAHLHSMQQNGLLVRHTDFRFQGWVVACSLENIFQACPPASADLVIITLKAMQTADVLAAMQDWLDASAAPVLSLQNGVDNEIAIEASVGRSRTLGGLAVRIGGHVIKPGVVEATGPAQVVLGAWPNAASPSVANLESLAADFNAAGIPTRIANDIRKELWQKLLINNGVNPLSALTGLDTRSLTSHPVYGDTVYRLMQETAAAARADEVEISQPEIDSMYDLICQFDAIKTSMLVDLEKGKAMEIDAICGAVLRRCETLRIAAPLTGLIGSLLADQESTLKGDVAGNR